MTSSDISSEDAFDINANKSLIHDDLMGLPVVQINNRILCGPPYNYEGEIPQTCCEIFVKNIPLHYKEKELLSLFMRFGQIYELRLMIENNKLNRGYGYIKYTREDSALRAMEIMNHYIVGYPQMTFEIKISLNKCRLFFGNIPKHLQIKEITSVLSELFEEATNIQIRNRDSTNNNNSGYGFLDFPDHKTALCIKIAYTRNVLRLWNRDIKVKWAFPENCDDNLNTKTIFVRNINLWVTVRDISELLAQFVPYEQIIKVSRNREYAFIECINRECAEHVLQHLQGYMYHGNKLNAEWAIPPDSSSVHVMKKNDFYANFRLMCFANNWTIPITIFGHFFDSDKAQNVAVLTRKNDIPVAYFFEVFLVRKCDILSRVYEVLVAIVSKHGQLPDKNLIFSITIENAHVIGCIPDLFEPKFQVARNIKFNRAIKIHWDEIRDLSLMIGYLSTVLFTTICQDYVNLLRCGNEYNYIKQVRINNRILGCVDPKYRQMDPLKYKINDMQIIFALCNYYTKNNFTIIPTTRTTLYTLPISMMDYTDQRLFYEKLILLPIPLISRKIVSDCEQLCVMEYGPVPSYDEFFRILYSMEEN